MKSADFTQDTFFATRIESCEIADIHSRVFELELWRSPANKASSRNKRDASATFVSSARGSDVGTPPALPGQRYDSTRLCTSDAAAARAPGGLLGSRLCGDRRLKTGHALNGGGAGPDRFITGFY